jgi:hypothetical protein
MRRLKDDVGLFQLAVTLDIDLVRPVHHDLGNGFVAQERLDRAEAQYVSHHTLEQPRPLGAPQENVFLGEDPVKQLLDRRPDLVCLGHVHIGIELSDQLVLYARLDVSIGIPGRR